MNPECPKCGKQMVGPWWRKAWSGDGEGRIVQQEHLEYACPCGYSEQRPTRDAKRPVGGA